MKEAPFQVRIYIFLRRVRLYFKFLVTLVFEEVTGKSVLLLPMGSCDDGAHSQNEKLNRENYIKGTKVMAEYIQQLGNL